MLTSHVALHLDTLIWREYHSGNRPMSIQVESKTLPCAICGAEVVHEHLSDYEPVTCPRTGRHYILRQYWPSKAHRDETGHDSTISERVYLE